MIDNYPKFLPLWTKAVKYTVKHGIRKNYLADDVIRIGNQKFNLDWYSTTCCLTGEAFFHEEAPIGECHECHVFTFGCSAFRSLDNFYRFKNELALHLQEKHTDIWNKWKDRI